MFGVGNDIFSSFEISNNVTLIYPYIYAINIHYSYFTFLYLDIRNERDFISG